MSLDLDAIEERAKAVARRPFVDFMVLAQAKYDVPKLIAEVRRLQAENADLQMSVNAAPSPTEWR